MNYSLELTNVSKNYANFSLSNISFSLPEGKIMGLVGENGAGKTTLINLILNEISRDNGIIKVFGDELLSKEKEIKDRIGIVFDQCNLPNQLTLKQLSFCLSHVYSKWDNNLFKSLLDRFKLPTQKQISSFSRGMKVKANLAIALSHNANLLILDEATSGLDPVVRNDVLEILFEYVQNTKNSILFSSHITSDLENIADYITFIHNGQLIFSKPITDLRRKYGILHCETQNFNIIDKKDIVAIVQDKHHYQILVSDINNINRKYQNLSLVPASLDDIIVFFIKGEKK